MKLDLTGLTVGPYQRWGAVRLVPLLRDRPVDGLRLDRRAYPEDLTIVDLGSSAYVSYIPHAFVATWGEEAGAAYGTRLSSVEEKATRVPHVPIAVRRRMARRVDPARLRFLPLHLAVEGYLSLHFGGPSIAWDTWSRQALLKGLSPRVEEAYSGAWVRGLEDALKHFEILDGQCGLMLYVADALAAVFVTPHPDDYRALHPTLIHDMYGEQVWQYSTAPYDVPEFDVDLNERNIHGVSDLRARLRIIEREWRDFHDDSLALDLLRSNEYTAETVYRMGTFTLSRFLPSFMRQQSSHIGEFITTHKGQIAYLKTFRLSTAQAKRGWTLNQLADADWDLYRAARNAGVTPERYVARLEAVGYGFLVREDLLNRFRRQSRHGT